jgi:hypothetical protein
MTWEDAIAFLGQRATPHFVKPTDDLKAFTGFIATQSVLQSMYETLVLHPHLLPEKIVIGPSYEVDAEWRLFIVDGEIISGSMYRPTGDSNIPSELLTFASQAIANWTPAPVFVLDIGRVNSDWRIIECNCFNWSRFYSADVASIVQKVSQHQRFHWQDISVEH